MELAKPYAYCACRSMVEEFNNLPPLDPDRIKTGDLWFGCFNPLREKYVTPQGKLFKLILMYASRSLVTHVGICVRDEPCPKYPKGRIWVVSLMFREKDEPYRMNDPMLGREGLVYMPLEFLTAMYDYVRIRQISKPIPNGVLRRALRETPHALLKRLNYLHTLFSTRKFGGTRRPKNVPHNEFTCSEHIYEVLKTCRVIKPNECVGTQPADWYHVKHDWDNPIEYLIPYGDPHRLVCRRDTDIGREILRINGKLERGPWQIGTTFGEKIDMGNLREIVQSIKDPKAVLPMLSRL